MFTRQPLSRPLRVPFLVLLLILIHAIHELPLTQPVLALELFLLPQVMQQVVHPVMLSRHHEPFELLPALSAVLHTQSLILASKLPQFQQLAFPLSRNNGPQSKQEYGILWHRQLGLFRNAQQLYQVFLF